MKTLPPQVQTAWETHEGPCALATVDREGRPNVILVSGVRVFSDGTFVIADNYMNKTRGNIDGGSSGALVFMTPDRKSYQIKGAFMYHTHGPHFDFMKSWNPAKYPGRGAVVLSVVQIFYGGEQLA
ncbi:MAG TPA: pyridoxamine 5'-phosphate oxidase family protein [Opitutaceae bacterium]|nr:pyridoxamine 5'-phosphate oxidase family protein [Opitutaceae bacterium]